LHQPVGNAFDNPATLRPLPWTIDVIHWLWCRLLKRFYFQSTERHRHLHCFDAVGWVAGRASRL